MGRLWGWTLQWACARAGAAATAAPGPSASTPSSSPAPTASSAPHPGCLQRSASAGASGAGGAGRGRPRRPGNQSGTAENEWVVASRRRYRAWTADSGVSSATFRPPDQPSRASSLGCGPLLPPGGRGAGVSWEGRSRGRVGLGAGRRRLGGGEGGSGRPAPGRGPAGWPRAWPGRATSVPLLVPREIGAIARVRGEAPSRGRCSARANWGGRAGEERVGALLGFH